MRARAIRVFVVILVSLGACGCGDRARSTNGEGPRVPGGTFTFGLQELGSVPEGATVVKGDWVVAEESGVKGILQKAQNDNADFNVLLADGASFGDAQIDVTVTALGGSFDNGGGPVWRAKDGDNYYVARWNPLEDNYRVYKVVDGVRTELASADTKPGSSTRVVRIRMRGDKIECWLDGELLLKVRDTTFPDAGAVGLWAKADAKTFFSSLEVAAP